MTFPKPPWDEATIRRFFTESPNQLFYSELLGFKFIELNCEEMWFEAGWEPDKRVSSPTGAVQGGMVTAMLDDVMSLAAITVAGFDGVVPTLEMKTSFISPVWPGPLKSKGQVIKKGKQFFFTEGWLWDAEDRLLAKASATCFHKPHSEVKRIKAERGL
ncbi:PaaI family thioesterase [Hyphobacterium sp.]|jgi:uncharacterized protein (TIGR00369 family)|uniref:PaaI family thioesterase n=1 Tax=Hyphobacterium sp. TaxID=2004662 RepID=UPI003BA86FC6